MISANFLFMQEGLVQVAATVQTNSMIHISLFHVDYHLKLLTSSLNIIQEKV